jgi:hypothetical protein
MEATTVAPQAGTPAGETTITCLALDERYQKLLRLRALKQQLAEVRSELETLEAELFAQPVWP